jgi:FkbM family methyltransferase
VTADQIYTNLNYGFDWMQRAGEIQDYYQDILKSGRTPLIIDCGGNIGLAAKYFADEYPSAKVVSIEPNAGNVEAARRNCSGYNNITVDQAAIGPSSGFVEIDNQDAEANAYRVSVTDRTSGIKMKTVTDIASEFDRCSLFIVKIDIEGFEADLFRDNIGWIDDCYVMIIELHDWMLTNSATSLNFLKAISSSESEGFPAVSRERIFDIVQQASAELRCTVRVFA